MPHRHTGFVELAILAIPCHVTMASANLPRRYARETVRLREDLSGPVLEEDEGPNGG